MKVINIPLLRIYRFCVLPSFRQSPLRSYVSLNPISLHLRTPKAPQWPLRLKVLLVVLYASGLSRGRRSTRVKWSESTHWEITKWYFNEVFPHCRLPDLLETSKWPYAGNMASPVRHAPISFRRPQITVVVTLDCLQGEYGAHSTTGQRMAADGPTRSVRPITDHHSTLLVLLIAIDYEPTNHYGLLPDSTETCLFLISTS